MIDVLYFADRDVTAKLLAYLHRKGLVMATAIPPHQAEGTVAKKEPFATLERKHGDVLTLVLVVDQGGAEGMWRDPLTNLADRLYPDDSKAAFAAAQGYCLVRDGLGAGSVRKSGDASADAWWLEQALSKLSAEIAPPDPGKKPAKGNAPKKDRAKAPDLDDVPTGKRKKVDVPAATQPDGDGPWAVLGIPRTATRAEAKAAWRALVVQYHPDKVAHLPAEFRALAEAKTREIMDAWREVEEALQDD